jgi:hypothetical protein
VRSLTVLLVVGVVFGASGLAGRVQQVERARQLVLGVVDDMAPSRTPSKGGPDDPHRAMLSSRRPTPKWHVSLEQVSVRRMRSLS